MCVSLLIALGAYLTDWTDSRRQLAASQAAASSRHPWCASCLLEVEERQSVHGGAPLAHLKCNSCRLRCPAALKHVTTEGRGSGSFSGYSGNDHLRTLAGGAAAC